MQLKALLIAFLALLPSLQGITLQKRLRIGLANNHSIYVAPGMHAIPIHPLYPDEPLPEGLYAFVPQDQATGVKYTLQGPPGRKKVLCLQSQRATSNKEAHVQDTWGGLFWNWKPPKATRGNVQYNPQKNKQLAQDKMWMAWPPKFFEIPLAIEETTRVTPKPIKVFDWRSGKHSGTGSAINALIVTNLINSRASLDELKKAAQSDILLISGVPIIRQSNFLKQFLPIKDHTAAIFDVYDWDHAYLGSISFIITGKDRHVDLSNQTARLYEIANLLATYCGCDENWEETAQDIGIYRYENLAPALYIAAKNKDFPLLNTFLHGGASPNVMHPSGDTPLRSAVEIGNFALCQLLIEAGADIDLRGFEGHTPLLSAIIYWPTNEPKEGFMAHDQIMNLLLENGADVNAADTFGNSPLHHAASKALYSAVQKLLAHHANPRAVNKDQETPLHWVVQAFEQNPDRMERIIDVLIQADTALIAQAKSVKAKGKSARPLIPILNCKNKYGETVLHKAANRGIAGLVKFLCSKSKINLDVQDKEGNTPLHLAIKKGNTTSLMIVPILLEHGADVEIKNTAGQTPQDLAQKIDAKDIQAALVKAITSVQEKTEAQL